MGRLGGALVVIVIGLVVVGLGVYMRPVVPEGWATAEGTVTSFRQQTDSEGDVAYTSVVTYTTQSGESRTIVNDFAFSGLGGDQLGDRTQVTYNPQNPDQARIIGGVTSWMWYIPLAIGALFLLIGAIVLLMGLLRAIRGR